MQFRLCLIELVDKAQPNQSSVYCYVQRARQDIARPGSRPRLRPLKEPDKDRIIYIFFFIYKNSKRNIDDKNKSNEI